MKYTKHETVTTHHLTVDLEPDDHIIVRMNDKKLFALSLSSFQTIQMRLLGEGDEINKVPFLEITRDQMEDLECDKAKGQYVNVTFPSALLVKVKQKLASLPIII